jgi:hypothetical protein
MRVHFPNRDFPERRTSRWIAGVSLTILVLLARDPIKLLLSSNQPAGIIVPVMGSLVVSALMLVFAVGSERFSMAQASTAAWIFVFLGMTAAYQVAQRHFPWLGQFDSNLVAKSAWVSFVGIVTIAVISNVSRLPFASLRSRRPPAVRPRDDHAITTWLRILVTLQVIATMLLVAYVGFDGITHGRTAFKAALAEASTRPGLGSAFFLATGLGIVLPATGIWARRALGIGSKRLLGVSLAMGFLATNPLIGSRFLIGSFGVAVVAALMTTSRWRRALPILAVVGLLFIFPSMDLWRGDGTGATGFTVQSPRTTLATGAFDGVEMLTRGIQVHDTTPEAQQQPLTQLGSAVFCWVPFAARAFPKIGSGAVIAQATGMKFTNVSMPIQGEGYLLAGWLGTIAVCGLLALWLRRLKNWYVYSHERVVGPTDAATAGLVFILLRGSILSVLDYVLLAVVVAWLLKPGSIPSRITRITVGR